MSWWLAMTASAGTSRRVGINVLVKCTIIPRYNKIQNVPDNAGRLAAGLFRLKPTSPPDSTGTPPDTGVIIPFLGISSQAAFGLFS
jgi:hypothetical protein